ncbi:MAG: hypothetical protein HC913_05515 [Microscillaceae bacterium]|nr:hypothetical protein [Microscillaceae bacterium]
MKKLWMLGIFAFSLLSLAHAQGPGLRNGQGPGQNQNRTPEQSAEAMTKRMDERLELSDAQQGQIYLINLEAAQANEALRNELKATREARQGNPLSPEEMQALRADMSERKRSIEQTRDTKIIALLTETQKPKYEQMKAEAKENFRNRMENRRNNRGQRPASEDDVFDF